MSSARVLTEARTSAQRAVPASERPQASQGTDNRGLGLLARAVLVGAPAVLLRLWEGGFGLSVLALAALSLLIAGLLGTRSVDHRTLVAVAVLCILSVPLVGRVTAMSVLLGAALLARAQWLSPDRPGEVQFVAGPVVSISVISGAIVGESASGAAVLVVQFAAVVLCFCGDRAVARLSALGRAMASALRVLVNWCGAVLGALLFIPTVFVQWLSHRVFGVDPLRRGSAPSAWMQRGTAASPVRMWTRGATSGPVGMSWRLRSAGAALLSAGLLVLAFFLIARLARDASAESPVEAVPAAVADDPWWPEYLETTRWLNTPGEDNPYDPFGPVRLHEVSSPYINVSDGIRRTWQPPGCEGCPELSVWMYGGSTTFGIGQRDEYTIPSQLARLAFDEGYVLEVSNRGVPADLHWEEAQRFAWDASGSERPDLVVFYDGTNEMWASSALNDLGRGDEVSLWNPEAENARRQYHEAIGTVDGFVEPPRPDGVEAERTNPDPGEPLVPQVLATHVAERYRRSVAMSRAAAESYGVPAVWIWQPCPQSGELVPGEPQVPTDVLESSAALCAGVAQDLPERVADLSGVFDDRTEPLYIDAFHTNEHGARIAAEAIFELLEPRLAVLSEESEQ